MNILANKVAVVTGGGRGIGKAIALQLASEGCDVAVLARSKSEVEQVADEIRNLSKGARRSLALSSDLSDGQAVQHDVAAVVQTLGPIDILINNAGIVEPMGSSLSIDVETWSQAIQINLISAFRWIYACLPTMLERGWGRIVNVSTGAAAGTGLVRNNAYSVSKAGLEMLTLNLAAELQGQGVTINAIRPGSVDTSMQTHIRNQPTERIGELYDLAQKFYTSGALLEPTQPALLLANLLKCEDNGEIISIYSPRGQELLAEQS